NKPCLPAPPPPASPSPWEMEQASAEHPVPSYYCRKKQPQSLLVLQTGPRGPVLLVSPVLSSPSPFLCAQGRFLKALLTPEPSDAFPAYSGKPPLPGEFEEGLYMGFEN
ncbi:hypothetical protein H1C71_028090, partial [Ictidomys tridecemlineatus]